MKEVQIAPAHTKVYNPAFDVTPAKYISGFITETGIIQP
jgi:methylthioribose-1-phosphate isomerase